MAVPQCHAGTETATSAPTRTAILGAGEMKLSVMKLASGAGSQVPGCTRATLRSAGSEPHPAITATAPIADATRATKHPFTPLIRPNEIAVPRRGDAAAVRTIRDARNQPVPDAVGHPAIRGQALFGYLTQITQGAATISIVLVVHQATGSLAAAGGVSAALWIVASIARPVQGRLIDRHGARPVMLACGPLHGAALIGLVAAARPGVDVWWLVLLSGAAGAGLPPVSAAMRVEWGRLLPAEARTSAYSLVYLTQEIAILTGPLLVAAVVASGSSGMALVIAAAISGGAAVVYGCSSAAGATNRVEVVKSRTARSTAMPVLIAISS